MAAGVANVTTIIKVEGRDAASRSINKAKGSLDRMGRSLTKVQTKAAAAAGSLRAMASGDAIGAVQGLTSAMGGAGGLAAVAAASTVGVVALGAAVGVAAVKFTEWSVQINRMKAGLDAALGPNGLEKAIAISNALGGVSAESIGKVATRLKLAGVNAEFTAEQLTELTKRATVAGKTGDEALEALASALEKGNTRALKLAGTFINSSKVLDDYARANDRTTTSLTAQEQQMIIVNAIQKNLAKRTGETTEAHDRQDRALSRLSNAWLSFKVRISDTADGPMVSIVEGLTGMIDLMKRLSTVVIRLVEFSFRPLVTWIEGLTTGMATFGMVASKVIARDFTGAMEEAKRGAREMERVVVTDNLKSFLNLGEAVVGVFENVEKKAASASLKVGDGFGGMFAGASAFIDSKVAGASKRGKLPGGGKKSTAITDIEKEREARRMRQEIQNEIKAEELADFNAKMERFNMLRRVEGEEIARGFDRLDMLAKEKAARGALNSTMFSSAKAAAVGAAGAIQSERARAGVMAIVAAADAALAYSTGNIPGGITATFAALQYAKVALMSAPQVPSSSGSATSSTGSAATPSAANGGTGTNVTVVLQGGVLVGTVQELGNFVQGAVSSLNGTGLARGTA